MKIIPLFEGVRGWVVDDGDDPPRKAGAFCPSKRRFSRELLCRGVAPRSMKIVVVVLVLVVVLRF